MKTQEIAVLAAAAAAVYLIWNSQKKTSAGTVTRPSSVDGYVNEIFNSGGTPYDNGWRYYDNGVAISPDGVYYKNGAQVWSPADALKGYV